MSTDNVESPRPEQSRPEQSALAQSRIEQLRAIIEMVLELDDGELADHASFVDDHGADSLSAIEILARIELELGLDIPQDELAQMTTLHEVGAVVARHASSEPSHA
jgi:acyl carrier protein